MKNVTLWVGGMMLALLILFVFLGPYLPFVDRELTEVKYRFTEIEGQRLMLPPFPPNPDNPLGSDRRGVDNLSKLVMGAKETIYIVVVIILLRYIIAVPLGLFAYKQRGFMHTLIHTWNNVFSFLPTVITAALILCTPLFTESPYRLHLGIIVVALLEVGRVAYIVQQQAYDISHMQYVEAGVALGLSKGRMIRNYYLRALFPEIIVNMCLDVSRVMLLIGQLGVLEIYLAHAVEPVPDPERFGLMVIVNEGSNWFALLAEHAQDIYFERFAFIFFPVLAIMYVILTFNVLGEGLRRYFNRHINAYI